MTRAGEVYCWGSNNYGQLGAGPGEKTGDGGRKVVGLANVVDVAVSYGATCARTEPGVLTLSVVGGS